MEGITSFIAQMSMNYSQARVQTQASVSMLKNSLDNMEQNGVGGIQALLESMPTGSTGGRMDITA